MATGVELLLPPPPPPQADKAKTEIERRVKRELNIKRVFALIHVLHKLGKDEKIDRPARCKTRDVLALYLFRAATMSTSSTLITALKPLIL